MPPVLLPSKFSLPRVGWQRPGNTRGQAVPRTRLPQRFRGVLCVARPIQDFGQGGHASYPTHVANIVPTNGQCCSAATWLQGSEADHKELLKEVREEVREEEERERALALAPYRVGAPKQGVIGESRHSKRLRRDVFAAAKDPTRKPVLIVGEDGLCKGDIAAVLHSCSLDNRHPMLSVDCRCLDPAGSLLLGGGSRRGLVAWMRHGGTLLLEHANRAPVGVVGEVLAQLRGPGCGCKGGCRGFDPGPRLVLTASGPLPAELQQQCTVIKVAPLRARASDIGPLQYHLLRKLAKAKGLAKMTLTQAAVRRLQGYAFPNNIRELESILERAAGSATVPAAAPAAAAAAAAAGPSTASSGGRNGAKSDTAAGVAAVELKDDAFWFASQDQAGTLHANISALPKALFQSDWWNEQLNFRVGTGAFVVLLDMLLLGPQDAEHNLGLNLVWDWWWPLIILSLPILGRMWCAVCPFMATGMLLQQWKLAQGGKLSRWPKWGEGLGPWLVYSLFAAILVWEEVWDLPNTAYLTAWLLMGITGGAVVGSWLFERRFWCRYLCPVGGMNGLFAKLSFTEMRGSQGVCSSNCNSQGVPCQLQSGTHHCPNNSHPSQLTDNHNCVVCMECLKACPNGSVEWRLRVPGLDLWTTHKPTVAEAALMFLLLGSVPLHHLGQVLQQAGIDPAAVLASQPAHIAASLAVLALPGVLCWAADWAWQNTLSTLSRGSTLTLVDAARPQGQPVGSATMPAIAALLAASAQEVAPSAEAAAQPALPPFLWRCYAYTPLAWAALLAHYLQPMLGHGGHAMPVTAATIGLDGSGWPGFTVHPEIIAFLQGTALLGGGGLSLLLNMKLSSTEGRAASAAQLMPHTVLALLMTGELWRLLLGSG